MEDKYLNCSVHLGECHSWHGHKNETTHGLTTPNPITFHFKLRNIRNQKWELSL